MLLIYKKVSLGTKKGNIIVYIVIKVAVFGEMVKDVFFVVEQMRDIVFSLLKITSG